jgi:uncharacterized protein YkwD
MAVALTGAGAQTDAALARAGRLKHGSGHHATRHNAARAHRRTHHPKGPPSITIQSTPSPAKRSVTPPAVPAGSCADANLAPDASDLAQIDAATVCLINKERSARGLVALAENRDLLRAARHHTRDMIGANYFDHVSPSGETPTQRVFATGYTSPGSSYELGENIAAASDGADTPAQMVAAWMNSSGHRANILNPKFRETAVAATDAVPAQYASGRRGGGTYTQEFGATS